MFEENLFDHILSRMGTVDRRPAPPRIGARCSRIVSNVAPNSAPERLAIRASVHLPAVGGMRGERYRAVPGGASGLPSLSGTGRSELPGDHADRQPWSTARGEQVPCATTDVLAHEFDLPDVPSDP